MYKLLLFKKEHISKCHIVEFTLYNFMTYFCKYIKNFFIYKKIDTQNFFHNGVKHFYLFYVEILNQLRIDMIQISGKKGKECHGAKSNKLL